MPLNKIFVFIILFLLILLTFSCNKLLLYKSESNIRKALLKKIPLGTEKDVVKRIVIENKYKIENENENWGYSERDEPNDIIGSSSIRVYLGEYQGLPWKVDVTVFFAFDNNNNLLEVAVRKEYDAF